MGKGDMHFLNARTESAPRIISECNRSTHELSKRIERTSVCV